MQAHQRLRGIPLPVYKLFGFELPNDPRFLVQFHLLLTNPFANPEVKKGPVNTPLSQYNLPEEFLRNPFNRPVLSRDRKASKAKASDNVRKYSTSSNTSGKMDYLYKLQPSKPEHSSNTFAVSDCETIMINDIHYPVMFGFAYYDYNIHSKSYEYTTKVFSVPRDCTDFITESNNITTQAIMYMNYLCTKRGIGFVYFHNLSFDGVFLLSALSKINPRYKFETLLLHGSIYKIDIHFSPQHKITIKCSYKLLPLGLDALAKSLVPHLGTKGQFDTTLVTAATYKDLYDQLLEYHSKDLLLTFYIVESAQKTFLKKYTVDINNVYSASGLAVKVYRTCFYDYSKNPIHYLSDNTEHFVRKGFYGGHVDVFKPFGENIFWYDVNSLYPFAMVDKQFPTGKPIYLKEGTHKLQLENLFGYFEATVYAPSSLNRPVLPYRDSEGQLTFPIGTFKGIYFSEELKYYLKFGYKYQIHSGYHWNTDQRSSPFDDYVKKLYASRLEAKASKNIAMDYFNKLLLNCLFGRLGINKLTGKALIVRQNELERVLQSNDIVDYTYIDGSDCYIVNISTLNEHGLHTGSDKTLNVACAAAITAYARITMSDYLVDYPVRYHDSDSLFLDCPLPDSLVDPMKLGYFKFEGLLSKAIFLGPKLYCLFPADKPESPIVKTAGLRNVPAEDIVQAYENQTTLQPISYYRAFLRDWLGL
jgi:hypothetical protein